MQILACNFIYNLKFNLMMVLYRLCNRYLEIDVN